MRLRGAKARGAGAEVAVGDIEQGQPPLHADGIGQHPQPPQLRRLPWLLVRALAPLAAADAARPPPPRWGRTRAHKP